jgi:hypothetical protein
MAVTIDELQVETQAAQAPANGSTTRGSGGSGGGSQQQGKQDIRAEMERLRERDLRLSAD